jgi:hypothetical protein
MPNCCCGVNYEFFFSGRLSCPLGWSGPMSAASTAEFPQLNARRPSALGDLRLYSAAQGVFPPTGEFHQLNALPAAKGSDCSPVTPASTAEFPQLNVLLAGEGFNPSPGRAAPTGEFHQLNASRQGRLRTCQKVRSHWAANVVVHLVAGLAAGGYSTLFARPANRRRPRNVSEPTPSIPECRSTGERQDLFYWRGSEPQPSMSVQ